jgi:hypothetical protein
MFEWVMQLKMKTPVNYSSEETLNHLRLQKGLSERYQQCAQDVTLVCKLTHVYGKIERG